MLEKQLKEYFGFNTFKNGQQAVVQKILDHQSAAAIFPTGAGKSLCYQLPALLLEGVTLVVSPLLSLMKDQLDFLSARSIPAARLDSTLSRDAYHRTVERAIKGELKILMISAERFKNERFRSRLQKMTISLLVIDEAHCISEWGHNFRPEYLNLPFYRTEFKIPQTLLLTATATERVVEDMCRKFDVPSDNVVVTGFYRENLYLQITPTVESEKKTDLLERVRMSPEAPTIVYTTLQRTAEDVAAFLRSNKINAHHYHAGMDTKTREDVQNQFMDGRLACVVATIAFGMGIDKADIRRVIHYDLPKSIENYSQEIGRSGRDGQQSLCEVLANTDNVTILENFIYGDTPERDSIYRLLKTLKTTDRSVWEIKLKSLSNEMDIRSLPLKTLLVYLAMEKIIRPRLSYFEAYEFKFTISPEAMTARFSGERKQFVSAIIANSRTRKVWTSVDIPGVLSSYDTDRQRVITALEYFDEQGWIELQSRQLVEVYDILTQTFDIDRVTDKLTMLFINKEKNDIQRIHHMVDFFESNACISRRLAAYFGEEIEKEACGHCSFCKSGQAVIKSTIELKSLAEVSYAGLSREFSETIGDQFTAINLTKFLCGIYTPVFTRLKVKKLPHFGVLDRHPFAEVYGWVQRNSGGSNERGTAQRSKRA